MVYCYLCNNVYVGVLTTKYHCEDCLKIKRYINLHGQRCLEILDSVLGRELDKQDLYLFDNLSIAHLAF